MPGIDVVDRRWQTAWRKYPKPQGACMPSAAVRLLVPAFAIATVATAITPGATSARVRTHAMTVAPARTASKRKCGPAVRPATLPDAGTLVDVEMVTAVLGSTVPADGEGLLVSLLYRRGATRPSIHILAPEALTPDSMAHIAAVLEPNLREVSAETQPYAVRLRVRGGDTPTLGVERSRYCPPAARLDEETRRVAVSTTLLTYSTERRPTTPQSSFGGKTMRVVVESAIDSTGAVLDVMMLRATNNAETDEMLLRDLRARHFLPALIDDVPIASWLRTDGTKMQM